MNNNPWRNAHTDPPPKSGAYDTRDTRYPDEPPEVLRYSTRTRAWCLPSGKVVIMGMSGREGLDEWRDRA